MNKLIFILLTVILVSCASAPNLYQKDRSFKNLDSTITAIFDGVLVNSADKMKLSYEQNQTITEYIRQNNLFKQKGFDAAWLEEKQENLRSLQIKEGNLIALPLLSRIEELYTESFKKN